MQMDRGAGLQGQASVSEHVQSGMRGCPSVCCMQKPGPKQEPWQWEMRWPPTEVLVQVVLFAPWRARPGPGTEVLINYGRKSNEELLLLYGAPAERGSAQFEAQFDV